MTPEEEAEQRKRDKFFGDEDEGDAVLKSMTKYSKKATENEHSPSADELRRMIEEKFK